MCAERKRENFCEANYSHEYFMNERESQIVKHYVLKSIFSKAIFLVVDLF